MVVFCPRVNYYEVLSLRASSSIDHDGEIFVLNEMTADEKLSLLAQRTFAKFAVSGCRVSKVSGIRSLKLYEKKIE